jgi:peptide/nickel transport system substrate-binding protein
MDIDIYARDDYYFGYDNPDFDALIEGLAGTEDVEARAALLGEAQQMLAEDSVNVFLFQLAKHGVWKAGVDGLWHNSPVPANDLTGVRWVE